MLGLSSRPLRTKVIAVVLVTTLVALIISTAALLAYDVENYRAFLVNDARTQAEILARANAPALAFNDPDAASSNLATLAFRPNFVAAAIYDAQGNVLATYTRDGAPVVLPKPAREQALQIFDDRLELVLPIVESGNLLGSVFLRAIYGLDERIWDYSLILGTVMLLSLVVALALSLLLTDSVTKPVLAVAAVAQRVIDERDFTLRAEKTTDDEVGALVSAFNEMLGEVEAHANALSASNARLREETQERRSAEAALIAADQRKNEFLATLAHELRNPLAPMVNAATLLRDPKAPSNRALEIMERQLHHLVRLVEDLLDVSRITSGKLTIRRQPMELAAVISDVEETVRPLLDSRCIHLSVSQPSEPLYVRADRVRLAQVLSNLLNNAIKYSSDGGSISMEVEAGGESVRVYVRDHGAGISESALPQIFDMFSQGESDTESSQSGLGVGLALAKRLMELHEGAIGAESLGLGHGSTFWIELPVYRGTAQIEAPAAGKPGHGSSHRVLLVDDNVDFATSLKSLLEMQGHTVQIANDGRSALKLAAEFRPDFGILDIGLPDISGYSLARRLRESPATGEVILIALSGWGQQSDRLKSSRAGFALHLVKPVGIEDVEAAMDALRRSCAS